MTFRALDATCLNVPDDCPAGHKWYMQSGAVQLVVETDLGPIGAGIEFILHALKTGRLNELEHFFSGSQTGFDDDSVIFSRPTRAFATRTCGIPEILFDGIDQ